MMQVVDLTCCLGDYSDDLHPGIGRYSACVEGRLHIYYGSFLETEEGRLAAARAKYDSRLQKLVETTITPCNCVKVVLPDDVERQVHEYLGR